MPSESIKFDIHKTRLQSGVRTLVLPVPGVRTVTFLLAVRTGSRNETAQRAGISHFIEHLVFKGSKKRPNTRKIAEAIDRVGGEMNAFTSKELTGFYAKASSRHVPLIVDVISDLLLNPLFNPVEIDRERNVVIEEINMYEDLPMRSICELFEETLFQGNSLAREIIGTKKNILRFTRADIIKEMSRQYRGQSVVACLAGNIEVSEGQEILKKALKGLRPGKATPVTKFSGSFGKTRVRVKEKKTDQTHIIVGVPAVSMLHKDRPAIDLMAAILGGGMSSRLFLEVREKRGLGYAIKTASEQFVDTGYIATQAGVETAKHLEAVSVIAKEHAKLCEKLVSKKELDKAKEYAKGKLILGLETSDEITQFAAVQEVLIDRILTPDKIFGLLDAVTPDDIQKAACRYLAPNKLRVVAIGPGSDEKKLAKALI